MPLLLAKDAQSKKYLADLTKPRQGFARHEEGH
jgi:hypothetical protein